MGRAELAKNVEEFGSRSSIHGVSYTLDRALSWLDRVLWLLLFLGSIALAAYMITTTVQDWRERQVVTTLKTMSKPVTGESSASASVHQYKGRFHLLSSYFWWINPNIFYF